MLAEPPDWIDKEAKRGKTWVHAQGFMAQLTLRLTCVYR